MCTRAKETRDHKTQYDLPDRKDSGTLLDKGGGSGTKGSSASPANPHAAGPAKAADPPCFTAALMPSQETAAPCSWLRSCPFV